MKRILLWGLIPLLALVAAVVVISQSNTLVFANPTVSDSASSSETPSLSGQVENVEVARANAAIGPIETRCRSNDDQMELCLSSNRRGAFSVFNGVSRDHYLYVFYDAPGQCPSFEGQQPRVTDWSVRELQFFGFTADDFAALGIPEYYCSFAQ